MPEAKFPVIREVPVSIILLGHRQDPEGWQLFDEAQASIRAQTFTDYQFLVQHCPPPFWGEKLNDIIRASRGERFAVVCYDDLLAPTWLEECMVVARETDADVIYTEIAKFGTPRGVHLLDSPLPEFSIESTWKECVPWVTALLKRRAFDDVGGYEPTLAFWDWDLPRRLALNGARGIKIPKPLFKSREHSQMGGQNMSKPLAFLQMQKMYEDAVAGVRAA